MAPALSSPYSVRIIDDVSGAVLTGCSTGTTCSIALGTGWAENIYPQPRHFHAEVKSSNGAAGTSTQLTVNVLRYIFSVDLAFTDPVIGADGKARSTATATTTRSVSGSSYAIKIRDDAGLVRAACSTGTTCSTTVEGGSSYQATVEDGAGRTFGWSPSWTLVDRPVRRERSSPHLFREATPGPLDLWLHRD